MKCKFEFAKLHMFLQNRQFMLKCYKLYGLKSKMSVAEGEQVFSRIDQHDGHECSLDRFSFGRSEEEVIEPVVPAGGKDEQVVLKIPLAFRRFLNEGEGVFAGKNNFVGNWIGFLCLQALIDFVDVRDDAVDVLFGVRAVVVGLQEDDVRSCFAGDIRANLRFVGLFFKHGDRHEKSSQRFDGHGGGDEDIRTPLFATFVEMTLNSTCFVILAFDEFDIVIIIPDHKRFQISEFRFQSSEFRVQNSDFRWFYVFDSYMLLTYCEFRVFLLSLNYIVLL